ncbi:RidA family protein [Anaerolineae bacterium CFX9]|jgi:2-iminobutanoate/2-iminopropanoate deaminase|nr:RidA family protein [Anaerolineae bacterium CFX9]
MKEVIRTSQAPAAIGPYSQAIRANGMLFCAGQVPLDPATGQMVEGGITEQTRRVLENVRGVLEAGGSSFDKVVKSTVFLTTMDDFAAMNEVYAEYFTGDAPARSTVAVAQLPRGARVEIEVIALL